MTGSTYAASVSSTGGQGLVLADEPAALRLLRHPCRGRPHSARAASSDHPRRSRAPPAGRSRRLRVWPRATNGRRPRRRPAPGWAQPPPPVGGPQPAGEAVAVWAAGAAPQPARGESYSPAASRSPRRKGRTSSPAASASAGSAPSASRPCCRSSTERCCTSAASSLYCSA